MKLVVGLGNPGKEYVNTRHNIGFGLLDYISKKDGYSFKFDKKFNCEMFSINIDGEKVLLIKPFSYMNLSGTVVSKIVSFYDIGVSDILVIQDDLDMEFGKIRIVFDSSSGGHNGIKNITENIGTQKYTRLKIGISNDDSIDTRDFVLGKFSKQQREELTHIYDKLDNIINDFVAMNTVELKQKYNSMNN